MIIAGMAGTGDIMQSTDAGEILSLLAAHKYALAAAVIIGAVVRMLKSDVDWFFTLPATFRPLAWLPTSPATARLAGWSVESKRVKPWIVVGLGALMIAFEKLGDGASWGKAFTDGFVAVVLPIVGHQLGIESLRGGKELPIPKPPSSPGAAGLLLIAALSLTGCGLGPGAKAPSADRVAKLAMNSIALGVRVTNEACRDRVHTIFVEEGDKERAFNLSQKCTREYQLARKALMAAAYAIEGWSDAKNHGKAVCALSEATTALSLSVEVVRAGGYWTPPHEVTLALGAVAVLAEMVEAKQCEVAS